MNAKLKKILTITAAALFLIALVINIKVTLNDPFIMVNKDAVAQETSGPGSGQKWIAKRVRCPDGEYGVGCFDGSKESCDPDNCF